MILNALTSLAGKKSDRIYIFIILAVAFFLRYLGVSSSGLWLDEIWSMKASASHLSVSQIVEMCAGDTHPPLFDILLHYALVITSDAEYTGRYLALFFGMAGVVGTYYYTQRITGNRSTALLASAILGLNHFHIIYSFEGRFYTLIYIFSLMSIGEIYLFCRTKKSLHLIIFTVVNILFLYTHYYGGILLLGLYLGLLILLLLRRIDRKVVIYITLAYALILLVFLPWMPNMVSKSDLSSWMSTPHLTDFFNYFYLYSGKNPLEFLLLLLPLLLSFKKLKSGSPLYVLLYASIFFGFLVPYVISLVKLPMLHVRYTFIYLPAIVLLAAIFWSTLDAFKPKMKMFAYAGVLIFTLINLIFIRKSLQGNSKDQWKEVSAYLKSEGANLVIAEQAWYLDYYLERDGLEPAVVPEEVETNLNSPFWILETNYDSGNILESNGLKVLEIIEFKGFSLHRAQFESVGNE